MSPPDHPAPMRAELGRWAERDLFRLVFPRAQGGLEKPFSELVHALEQLGRDSLDAGLVVSANAHLWGSLLPLSRYGGPDTLPWLEQLLRGQWIGGHAITEATAGSDIQALEMQAERTADGYRLNGCKSFITNAPIADLLVVYARLEDELSAFVVLRDDPNTIFDDPVRLCASRSSPIGRVHLRQCTLPESRLLGKPGSGSSILQQALEHERAFIFAGLTGIMEWQLATVIAHSRHRRSGGQPLGRHQAISHTIADMKIRLDTSRLWIAECARLKDSGRRITLASAETKACVAEAFLQSCLDAVHILGAGGLESGQRMNELVQDALAGRLFSGSSEIQKNIIATLLGTGEGFRG